MQKLELDEKNLIRIKFNKNLQIKEKLENQALDILQKQEQKDEKVNYARIHDELVILKKYFAFNWLRILSFVVLL